MFYDEIGTLAGEKSDLVIKIIIRPKEDIKGDRRRIAIGAIDELCKAIKGNLVESKLIHSRMIIVDNEQVLVSSADLTRDQLYDEFNAGIWTSDKETVKKAIEFS